MIFMMRYVMPFFRRIFKKYDALNNSIQENVHGMRVVKSFVREDYEINKFGKANGELRSAGFSAMKVVIFMMPVMNIFMYLHL